MFELSKKDKVFFETAKQISSFSDHRCKIGCVLVDKHRIVSSGYNSNTKCHPIQANIDKHTFKIDCPGKLHAEVATIIPLLKYKTDLSRATVYTYRQTAEGHLAMSRPCSRCMAFLKQNGIRRIKYTTPDGYVSEILEA